MENLTYVLQRPSIEGNHLRTAAKHFSISFALFEVCITANRS